MAWYIQNVNVRNKEMRKLQNLVFFGLDLTCVAYDCTIIPEICTKKFYVLG